MSLPVSCVCGKTANVPDAYLGSDVKCPDCGKTITVSAARSELSYPRNEGYEEMDYKRNYLYFFPKKEESLVTPIIMIVVGMLILLAWTSYPRLIVMTSMPVLIIGVILVVIIIIKNSNIVTISDAEIDKICEANLKNLKSMALEKLGIDEEQVNAAEPVQVGDYYHGKVAGFRAARKIGNDEILRSSNYVAGIFFFSGEQVFGYWFYFSLLKDVRDEITNEYFYGDIVSLTTTASTVTLNKGEDTTGEKIGGWFTKNGAGKNQSANKEKQYIEKSFVLNTTGATSMAVSYPDKKERSVKAMRSLLREKKKELHSNEVFTKSGG